MTFYKWTSDGTCTWLSSSTAGSLDTELNGTIGEVQAPIGSIVAWAKSFSGTPSTLPLGWVECDGTVISDSDSPFNGETLPDLNAGNRFLRGSTTSGALSGSDTHTHGKTTANDITSSSGGATTSFGDATISGSNVPSYYAIVWIMRIK